MMDRDVELHRRDFETDIVNSSDEPVMIWMAPHDWWRVQSVVGHPIRLHPPRRTPRVGGARLIGSMLIGMGCAGVVVLTAAGELTGVWAFADLAIAMLATYRLGIEVGRRAR